jgi:hypothetical protein
MKPFPTSRHLKGWLLTLPGLVMLANNLMLMLFYLVLVVPYLWYLRPPKSETPF